MNTSRTESGNRYSRGMVTVCERLFHPTRAVGLGVGVWCIAMYQSIWLLSPYGKPYVKWRTTLRCGLGLAGTSGWSANKVGQGSKEPGGGRWGALRVRTRSCQPSRHPSMLALPSPSLLLVPMVDDLHDLRLIVRGITRCHDETPRNW
jgi:hypothetical protein